MEALKREKDDKTCLEATEESGWATAGRRKVRGGEAGEVGRGLGTAGLFLSGLSVPVGAWCLWSRPHCVEQSKRICKALKGPCQPGCLSPAQTGVVWHSGKTIPNRRGSACDLGSETTTLAQLLCLQMGNKWRTDHFSSPGCHSASVKQCAH